MTIWDAPLGQPLCIVSFAGLSREERSVLTNLGLEEGEWVEKRHVAPLGEPVSLLVGSHVFTLRAKVCRQIQVRLP